MMRGCMLIRSRTSFPQIIINTGIRANRPSRVMPVLASTRKSGHFLQGMTSEFRSMTKKAAQSLLSTKSFS